MTEDPSDASTQLEVQLGISFKLIFLSVLAITGASFLASIGLSVAESSENVDRVLEVALTTYKLGFGAIIGLLGGKQL